MATSGLHYSSAQIEYFVCSIKNNFEIPNASSALCNIFSEIDAQNIKSFCYRLPINVYVPFVSSVFAITSIVIVLRREPNNSVINCMQKEILEFPKLYQNRKHVLNISSGWSTGDKAKHPVKCFERLQKSFFAT